jgi:hypothetical protein
VDTTVRTSNLVSEENVSAVYWASIAAGGVASAVLSLALLALGTGLGLSSVSPWGDSNVSASTFNNITGAYLVIMAIIASAIGGYLADRLRTKWTGLHTNEVFFRDTAPRLYCLGFRERAERECIGRRGHPPSSAGPLRERCLPQLRRPDRPHRRSLSTGCSGPMPAASQPAGSVAPAATPGTGNEVARAEVNRLWAMSFRDGNELAPADRTYVARLVAAQTGMSQQDAERRGNEVVNQAKAAADAARRGAAKLAFGMTAAPIFGAFASSLAAVEGGQLRDGSWSERGIVKRAWI